MMRRFNKECEWLRERHPCVVVRGTTMLCFCRYNMALRVACPPNFPFVQPRVEVAVTVPRLVLERVLPSPDLVPAVLRQLHRFCEAKRFFFDHGTAREAQYATESMYDKWSPAVTVADLVERLQRARAGDVDRAYTLIRHRCGM